MADSIEAVLTLGWDSGIPRELHEHITAPALIDGQHLSLISGGRTGEEWRSGDADLPGSGQAGTVRVYAGCIRRGNGFDIARHLNSDLGVWGSAGGILVIHDDRGPWPHVVGFQL